MEVAKLKSMQNKIGSRRGAQQVSTMKSWKLALAAAVVLCSATSGDTKVIALVASPSTVAGGEISSGRMLRQPNSFTGATHSSTGSARPGGIRATNAGMILLTIGALVAYQLRRKQRLLEQSPFAG
jgi:hypothetical protein